MAKTPFRRKGTRLSVSFVSQRGCRGLEFGCMLLRTKICGRSRVGCCCASRTRR